MREQTGMSTEYEKVHIVLIPL